MANNCGEKCKKEFHNNDIEHNCNEKHFCKNECYLKDKSKNCKINCCLEYGHEEICICKINSDAHKCNKKCEITDECERDCILKAAHQGKCLCGKCKCPEDCELKNCTRECREKCSENAGHPGTKHNCNSIHLCPKKCKYLKISKKCNRYCYQEYYNHTIKEHICNISISSHGCHGICFYKDKARECIGDCCLEVGHKGNHVCSIKKENKHLCKEICVLSKISRNCTTNCNQYYKHNGAHICDLKIEKHICSGICFLKEYSIKESCSIYCCRPAGHKGNCLCNIKFHKCKGICYLKKTRNCKKYCELAPGHEGKHQCKLRENEHKCDGQCYLYGKYKCKKNCCKNYNHEGKCICENYHLCNEVCNICKENCCFPYGHGTIIKEKQNINYKNLYFSHLCDNKHFCRRLCFYYEKFKDYPEKLSECHKFCCLEIGHKGKCICENPHFHPCINKCSLWEKSNGCNENCKYEYYHPGDCICSIEPQNHSCKIKCELCQNDCGHVYNHEQSDNLGCFKCKNKICTLSKKGHLCGSTHDCNAECSEQGYCFISSFTKKEEQKEGIYYTKLEGKRIQYIEVNCQKIIKKKCKIGISPNKFGHSGKKHSCLSLSHQCGFQCKQCKFYCSKSYGHIGDHECEHGNIKNSFIYITDTNEIDYAIVQKEKEKVKFVGGETAKIFTCPNYCHNQGQGHIHYFDSKKKINETNDVKFHEKRNGIYI